MKKSILAAIYTAVLGSVLYAGVGTTSMDILKVPSGIKSQAMGGAYVGLADGLDAMDINPAGMANITKNEILFVHDLYFQDTFFDSLYFGHGLGDIGTAGISLKYLNTGKITSQLEDSAGNYAGNGDVKTGYDYLLGFSYGMNLGKIAYSDFTKNVNVGASLKVGGESLGNEYSNNSLSVDLGGIYTIIMEDADFMSNRGETIWNKTGIGVVFRNVGTSFGANMTPMTIALGAYTQWLNLFVSSNIVRVTADTDYDLDNGINIRAGVEYNQYIETFHVTLRLGSNFNPAGSTFSGYTVGMGAGMNIGGTDYEFDYALLPYGNLGMNNKLGLYVKF
jgi:hypothetical protein